MKMFLDAVNIGTRTLSKVDGPPREAGPHTVPGGLYRAKEQPSTDCLPLHWNIGFPQPLDSNWNISSFWVLTLGICRSWAISTSIIIWVNSLLYNPFLYKCLSYQFYFSREPWLIDTVYYNSLCILVFSISLWGLRGQWLSHSYKHTA